MEFPHESLNLNTTRGLLAAEMGNGATLPGLMSIYDVSKDCLHPTLDSTFLAAPFGHESGFAPDGRTFYIGGGEGIAAVDVTDPKHPHTLWEGAIYAHGLNVSDDGNTLYDADPINGNLVLFNVSQIQERKPHPVVTEISRMTWNTVSIPQNTAPMTIDGHHYLLEFDEFAFRFSTLPPADQVGAARILNIDDPAHPHVVSNLRLAVNMPAEHHAADGDPSALPLQQFTYSAHYCAVPREIDPEIVACSFINSGLRIFNIQDPLHPREVGYYVSPPRASSGGGPASDFALSQPAFVPDRREVWYTDATSGFYDVRLDPSIWPSPTVLATRRTCSAATGRLDGRRLGPVALGMRRRAVRARFAHFAARGNVDVLCLRGSGIRVGFRSGRAVIALSANRHYSLRGARPGMRFSPRARGLRVRASYRIGGVSWYLASLPGATGLLRVHHGLIAEVGIAIRGLTDRAHARRFLVGFH
jgi:hypothetical protein